MPPVSCGDCGHKVGAAGKTAYNQFELTHLSTYIVLTAHINWVRIPLSSTGPTFSRLPIFIMSEATSKPEAFSLHELSTALSEGPPPGSQVFSSSPPSSPPSERPVSPSPITSITGSEAPSAQSTCGKSSRPTRRCPPLRRNAVYQGGIQKPAAVRPSCRTHVQTPTEPGWYSAFCASPVGTKGEGANEGDRTISEKTVSPEGLRGQDVPMTDD
jgi:hypothetical protein